MSGRTSLVERFDELRAAHPELGFGLYAIEPRGVVTFEVMTPDGQAYSWRALTAEAAMDLAFPPTAAPHDWTEHQSPPEEIPDSPEPETTGSIFD